MRILFSEEALQTGSGHWPLYIADISTAFRQAGDHVHVLAHRHAVPTLLADLSATPWFSRNCWQDQSCQGGLGGIRHAFRFTRELATWLRRNPNTTWVCALTMRLQHLLAFSLLCRRPLHRGNRRYLLLFVQGFGTYQGPCLPVAFPATTSTRLARWCFQQLAPAVKSGQVVLAAETRAMQCELEAFSQLPVRLFPHPVAFNCESSTPLPSVSGTNTTAVTITCPGFARYEKGNDLLQEAWRQVLADEPLLDITLVSQWKEPFDLPSGTQASPDPALLATGRYQLINHSLNRQAYAALLARSDLVVLPYRRSSYHNRLSRVAIEAALFGIPLVFMSGTWCEEIVELTGAGVPIAAETPEAVCQALRSAIDALPALRERASQASLQVREHYSAQRFRQLLLEC